MIRIISGRFSRVASACLAGAIPLAEGGGAELNGAAGVGTELGDDEDICKILPVQRASCPLDAGMAAQYTGLVGPPIRVRVRAAHPFMGKADALRQE